MPVGLVVDVAEDQTVQIEREKTGDRRSGDVLASSCSVADVAG